MAEESWHIARLIPTSGINGAEEQERRATSALLAVLSSVREFGRALTQPLGAPAGAVETFIEVPFTLNERRLFPDGLIRVKRGSKQWTALVEVKTGKNGLDAQQIENYLEIAREHDFDAVITISNEIPAVSGQHPVKLDKRKLRKVAVRHWSWSKVLAEAVLQKEHRGIADPDQAWILGELIRYLEHPKSGALEFDDMGNEWVSVREAVASGTLRANDKSVPSVVNRYDALLRYASLQLGRQLGEEVTPALTRTELADPSVRTEALVQQLCTSGSFKGGIRIPNAVSTLWVTADLAGGRIICHADLDGPKEGRPATRVRWLLRQLKSAPGDLRLESYLMHARGPGAAELLDKVREDPVLLVQHPSKEIRSFRIAQISTLGPKRGRGRGAFIDSITSAVNTFYAEVLQNLKAWSSSPPRMREIHSGQVMKPQVASTALSSQDGAEETESSPFRPEPRSIEAPEVVVKE